MLNNQLKEKLVKKKQSIKREHTVNFRLEMVQYTDSGSA